MYIACFSVSLSYDQNRHLRAVSSTRKDRDFCRFFIFAFVLFVCLFFVSFLSSSFIILYAVFVCSLLDIPQWGAADAEIKVPSGENTELKRSPFQAWSRSVYSHTCYAYCQGFLPCLFLHFRSIHLHFFQNLSRNFSCVGCS